MAGQRKPPQGQLRSTQKPPGFIKVAVSWDIPPDMPPQSATHIVVQRDGPEFIVNVFEVRPPLIVGSTEEERRKNLQKQLKGGELQARCVVRLVVAAERMEEFIKPLSEALTLSADAMLKIEEEPTNE